MEMAAAKVVTELALSGLFRVVSILNKNFRDVITTEEMKPLNNFVDCEIEVLTKEVKSNDLGMLMPSLKKLQAAALELEDQLDLYEYDHIEQQVNSSSSSEPIPKENVLPLHLRMGLDKLLMNVERVENKRQSITTSNSFIEFLIGESHVARPVIKLVLSDISRLIEMLASHFGDFIAFHKILEQLKDVVSYHIQALIRKVNLHYSAQSMLQAASLQLDLFDFDSHEYDNIYSQYDTVEQASSSDYTSFGITELRPILSKSSLRLGLETLLNLVEQVEKKHTSITSRTGTIQPQANAITPTLRSGVEKWLKFVDQDEKEHPYISSTHPRAYTKTPISATFFPCRGLLSTMSLENVDSQEDVEEIMQNHKNNLKKLIFGWTNTERSIDTCKKVLERLEPGQNLENLSIIQYSRSELPNWMEKKNGLPHLQTLELRSCVNLKVVPSLPPRLRELDIYGCCKLILLSLASDTLRTVKLVGCPMYNTCFIDSAFRMNNLETLELRGLPNIGCLPNLSPTVTKLLIEDCPNLTSLGNVHRCTSLIYLQIGKCPKLMIQEASLVEGVVEGDIANPLPQVHSISIDEPLLVIRLVQQQALRSTRVLSFGRLYRRCIDLFDKHFHQFSSLDDLTLQNCEALPNLGKLSSLKSLSIFECYNDVSLPQLPVSLQYIRISICPKLKKNYKLGGELRNTISHIPEVVID